jgi:hypothetical protein
MAAPATAAAEGGVENFSKSSHYNKSPWKDEVDDAALTGNEGTEADITRLIAADEEALLAEVDEEDELSISPRQEFLETLKLLASGGIAGAVSKSATAPLARLTILYQVYPSNSLINDTNQLQICIATASTPQFQILLFLNLLLSFSSKYYR